MKLLVEGTTDRAVVLFGSGTDPNPELTWARGVTLVADDETGNDLDHHGPVGVVGWSDGGLAALAFAARHSGIVDRVVLIATPYVPAETNVPAKTLLLFGTKDPLTGSRHAGLWKKRIPHARLEMNPDGGHDLLTPMWSRVLSHVAPRCKR
ncbi:pimeloyl-ACP methyl ester carboxylesterase [Actinoplanes lutulentus]|uniref:Alpha/beta hydrolase family protein n=1 Tax=Actinoplanes lutulentus TaxID=1287878 RepID=A0A327Z591_9ACTN|nr:hypothetical protein [Actinoplanes lutulentus]MBB2949075.1 pimeloyl-ACP methyl ester carboxylesterase [Actinoplanes lutulentus]RAK31396.1 hypothetical protein B0I29_115203 [Actinoplanes lutulentus]